MLRATKDFAVGDLIVEDVGATVVLTGTQLGEVYCHVCYEPSAKLTCKGCQLFATCPTCARVALRPHQERCSAFAKFTDLAKESSTDLDMLRLLAQVLFTAVEARREKSMQQQQGDVATVTAAMTATTTKDDPSRLPINKDKVSLLNGLDELIVDRNAFAPAWHASIRQGCAALLALMRSHFPGEIQPEDGDEGFAGYGLDALCDMAIRVNLASFGLPDREGRNRTFAVGLFPVMGLLNHSCAPKAVFTASKGGRMALRAVRPIPRGEEVTTSYIDLFNSRDDRRRDLMHTKHFFCMCARCTDEQYERFPADRFLDHPLCPRCREDVAVPEIFAVQPLDEDDEDENYFYAYAEAHGGHAKGHASESNCESRDCDHAPPSSSRPTRHRRLVESTPSHFAVQFAHRVVADGSYCVPLFQRIVAMAARRSSLAKRSSGPSITVRQRSPLRVAFTIRAAMPRRRTFTIMSLMPMTGRSGKCTPTTAFSLTR